MLGLARNFAKKNTGAGQQMSAAQLSQLSIASVLRFTVFLCQPGRNWGTYPSLTDASRRTQHPGVRTHFVAGRRNALLVLLICWDILHGHAVYLSPVAVLGTPVDLTVTLHKAPEHSPHQRMVLITFEALAFECKKCAEGPEDGDCRACHPRDSRGFGYAV